MFHYPTLRPPASHKCLEKLNPKYNSNQLQQQLFHVTGVQVSTQTVRNCLHVAHSLNVVLPLNASHHQARRVWCQLCQRRAATWWSNFTCSDFQDMQQRVWHQTKGYCQFPAQTQSFLAPFLQNSAITGLKGHSYIHTLVYRNHL